MTPEGAKADRDSREAFLNKRKGFLALVEMC
jgi:hypothetical protein